MGFFNSKIKTKAKIYKLFRLWPFSAAVFLIFIIGILALGLSIFYEYGYVAAEKLEYLFFSILTLFFIIFLSLYIYYKGEIKKPRIKLPLKEACARAINKQEKINLSDYLTNDAYLTILKATKFNEAKQPNIDNKSLLLALIEDKMAQELMLRFGINRQSFIDGLNKRYPKNRILKDDEMQNSDEFIGKAALIASEEEHERIEIGDLLAVLALSDPYFKSVLFDLNLKNADVLNLTYWLSAFYKERELRKFNPDHLKLYGGIGRDWGAGYTPWLSRYANDLTEEILKFKRSLHLIGHEKEIQNLGKVLVRATHHNVLLVGEPGVGKKTIVLGLSKAIATGHVSKSLRHRHIMELSVDQVLAGAESSGEIIERLNGIFSDAVRAGNIILFIDHIEALFGGSISAVGAIDASQVIIPYLEHPELYFIGTTILSDFHQSIETRPGIVDKFEKIEVNEPDKEITLRILQDLSPVIEGRTRTIFSYEALKSIIELSEQYIYNKFFPEKALDLLDEVAVFASRRGRGVLVMPSHVEEVMRGKTQAPIGEAGGAERERLLNLEEFLHKRVIGQEEAVNVVADAMRRARAGVGAGKKPIGSFLFLGPTGVGKTETCKALAASYFGAESAMIRFDMSEYQDPQSLYRFIGAPPGAQEAQAGGQLTNAVKDKPFSLVLLDEIEKAYPDILNLFLQVLDEGWLTDSLGRKVKFNNVIIIGTSNAGAELIQKCVQENIPFDQMKKSLMNYLVEKRIFRPEFLNRFNAVVTFKPLTEQEVTLITDLLLKKLAKKLEEEKGIYLQFTAEAVVKMAKLGFDPMLGARPISRVIEKKVEGVLAKRMLSGEVKRGSEVVVREEDIK